MNGLLVGHAFSFSFTYGPGESQRLCVWVTQLVVHSDHRHQGIAQRLCALSWEPHSDAWGLVSSHPYAVRALETATARFCDASWIKERAAALVSSCPVTYIQGAKLASEGTQIDTQFFVDHAKVNEIAVGMGGFVEAREARRRNGVRRSHLQVSTSDKVTKPFHGISANQVDTTIAGLVRKGMASCSEGRKRRAKPRMIQHLFVCPTNSSCFVNYFEINLTRLLSNQ